MFEEETRFNIEEYTSERQLQEKIDSSLRGLKMDHLLEEQKKLHRELIEAEREGDQKTHDEVAKKYMDISKEIQSLK